MKKIILYILSLIILSSFSYALAGENDENTIIKIDIYLENIYEI